MQTHYMHYDVWQCDEKNKSKESVFLLSWRNGWVIVFIPSPWIVGHLIYM